MAELLDYSKLTKAQQGVYNDIVSFGKSHSFSQDQMNRVLLLGFVESGFNANATNSQTIQGVFQYGSSRWKDYCSDDQYSTVGLSVWQTLVGWGYVGGNKPATFNLGNTDKQIAVTFAVLKVLETEFTSGTRHSEFVTQYWTAYDNAMTALGDKAPTTQADKMMLFLEAGHHGPSNISEVVSGWKNKVEPNIERNLLNLKGLKISLLLDDTDLTVDKMTESVISEASTQLADVDDDSPATLQAIQNAIDRESVKSSLEEILSGETGNQIVDVKPVIGESIAITFAGGNRYNINRDGTYAFETVSDPTYGTPTNSFSLTNTTDASQANQSGSEDPTRPVNRDGNTILDNGVSEVSIDFNDENYDVNTSHKGVVPANLATDGTRPGENTINDESPFVTLTDFNGDLIVAGSMSNGTQGLAELTPTDPLVLDLNGDGVRLTDFASNPVLFDADHDGAQELSGWVSREDGILVVDRNGNDKIDDISETLSEYYGGTQGEGGSPGTKPFAHGFAALKSLDTGNGMPGSDGYNDNQFTSADAAWNSVKVWLDANHDGKSWDDVNGNREMDAGEDTELVSLSSLGITSINLTYDTQSGLIRDGNEILASGTFVRDSATKEALAANFLYNPNGHTFTTEDSGTKIKITTQGDGVSDPVTAYASSSTTGEIINVATVVQGGVINAYGGSGADTLNGDEQDNVLAGGPGSDTFSAWEGNDVLIIDADDLQANIHAGTDPDGKDLDMVQVVGDDGVVLNLYQAEVEIAQGGRGNDVLIGGGLSSVFIAGGTGDDILIGGAANDVLNGEDGNDLIDGGAGNDIIRGHRGQDFLTGGAGDDLLDGGLDDDQLQGGAGKNALIGGTGDDVIDGGEDIFIDGENQDPDIAEYTGSYAEYRITQTEQGVIISDMVSGRDGTDILTNVENLKFKDLNWIALDLNSPIPVKDVLAADIYGDAFNRTLPQGKSYYTIRKEQIIANDIDYQGHTPEILAYYDIDGNVIQDEFLPVQGGELKILNGEGDVAFRPNEDYTGFINFKYSVKYTDTAPGGQTYETKVWLPGSLDQVTMRAAVYLKTPDMPTDPLVTDQWYLSDANILPVWKDYTGKGVRIGQFEPGGPFAVTREILDYRHPDLQPNIDAQWLADPVNLAGEGARCM